MTGLAITETLGEWAVYNGAERIAGPYNEYWKADAALTRAKRKLTHKKRSCMTCRAPFMSEGPHNRMCTPCRKAANETYEGAV